MTFLQMTRPIRRPARSGRFLSAIAASAVLVSLGSCASNPTPSDSTVAPTDDSVEELRVVTTFLPITQFTRAVAGDRAEVTQLIPANTGPHDYQAKPADVQNLAEADVLVENGLELEEFLEDMVANAENPGLQTINSSEGIATIANEAVEGHAEGEAHSHAEGEEHAEGEAGHSHEGEYNPHVWLDPKRAIQQVENIRDGLIAADPEGEAEYTANAAAYIEQLQELDDEITATLNPYSGQTFVAFHDFAPYFANSYGLEAEFLVDVPEESPSPEDVKRVSDEVSESDLKTILSEPQAGEDALSALAQDLGITVSLFDPIETGGPEAMEPEYYFTVMRQNVENLASAFGGSAQSSLPGLVRVGG
ncbi:metal ABC transporter solute-binding protein, Zn/Mn family [Vasconcelosia minhoensis]|nr:zinc ABC transporter substrate-binding protein [Romeria gracilis]